MTDRRTFCLASLLGLAQPVRLAQALTLKDDGAEKILTIETGHKAFAIKAESNRELAQWHLRLQEVIMLQEKVANVAHGWLLK